MRRLRTNPYDVQLPVVALLLVLAVTAEASAQWRVTQLTDNDHYDWTGQSSVHGPALVWIGKPDNADNEIFLYDGHTVTQLTDNTFPDAAPSTDGASVAWTAEPSDGTDREIYFWNGNTTTRLTDNADDRNDLWPTVDDSTVVWHGGTAVPGATDWEIFLYEDGSVTQLTANDYNDYYPFVVGENIVWRGQEGGTDYEIFFHDGDSTVQLTDNSYDDKNPEVDRLGNVLWEGEVGDGDKEIFFCDGDLVTQLTDNAQDDGWSNLDGGEAVWERQEGGDDYEIFYFDGSDTTMLTDDLLDDRHPRIVGSLIAWEGDDGNDTEIFVYEIGKGITHLTNNDFDDEYPRIAGNMIGWTGYVDGEDGEIFVATPVPEPSAMILLTIGLVTLLGWRRCRR